MDFFIESVGFQTFSRSKTCTSIHARLSDDDSVATPYDQCRQRGGTAANPKQLYFFHYLPNLTAHGYQINGSFKS